MSRTRLRPLAASVLALLLFAQATAAFAMTDVVSVERVSGAQGGERPRVSDGLVVWNTRIGSYFDVLAWAGAGAINISNRSAPVDEFTPVFDDQHARVSGGRVVWVGHSESEDGVDHEVFTWAPGGLPLNISRRHGLEDGDAEVSGGRVVWVGRSADWVPDVYTWTQTDGVRKLSTSADVLDEAPQVSGDRVVWHGSSDEGDSDVYTWAPGDVSPLRLSAGATTWDQNPQVSGNRVVWEADNTVCLWTAGSPVITRLGVGRLPRVSGTRVAWENDGEIYTWRVGDAGPLNVSNAPAAIDRNARIDGDRIVWERVSGSAAEIYVWTVGDREPANVSRHADAEDFNADISGNRIVWERVEFPNHGVYSAVVTTTPDPPIVKTHVTLSTPVAPTSTYVNRPFKAYGDLRPRKKAGTSPVRIYRYRYVAGGWKSYGYFKAKVSDHSTYSRYAATVRLPHAGRWRLRAYYPADELHKATWSERYDYIDVKKLKGYALMSLRYPASRMPIRYYINPSGLPAGSVTAIRKAAQQWEDDPRSAVDFRYMGTTKRKPLVQDGYNVVGVGGEHPWGGAADAYAPIIHWWKQSGSGRRTNIYEMDLVFVRGRPWFTDQTPDRRPGGMDVQGTAAHEFGHWLGLDHPAKMSKDPQVMSAYGELGSTYRRTLRWGDRAGARYLFPQR